MLRGNRSGKRAASTSLDASGFARWDGACQDAQLELHARIVCCDLALTNAEAYHRATWLKVLLLSKHSRVLTSPDGNVSLLCWKSAGRMCYWDRSRWLILVSKCFSLSLEIDHVRYDTLKKRKKKAALPAKDRAYEPQVSSMHFSRSHGS